MKDEELNLEEIEVSLTLGSVPKKTDEPISIGLGESVDDRGKVRFKFVCSRSKENTIYEVLL
jgi:hypothetical protein